MTYRADALTVNYPVFADDADKAFYYDAIPAQDRDETVVSYEAWVQGDHEMFDDDGRVNLHWNRW